SGRTVRRSCTIGSASAPPRSKLCIGKASSKTPVTWAPTRPGGSLLISARRSMRLRLHENYRLVPYTPSYAAHAIASLDGSLPFDPVDGLPLHRIFAGDSWPL